MHARWATRLTSIPSPARPAPGRAYRRAHSPAPASSRHRARCARRQAAAFTAVWAGTGAARSAPPISRRPGGPPACLPGGFLRPLQPVSVQRRGAATGSGAGRRGMDTSKTHARTLQHVQDTCARYTRAGVACACRGTRLIWGGMGVETGLRDDPLESGRGPGALSGVLRTGVCLQPCATTCLSVQRLGAAMGARAGAGQDGHGRGGGRTRVYGHVQDAGGPGPGPACACRGHQARSPTHPPPHPSTLLLDAPGGG
jgi:hypothetical protein